MKNELLKWAGERGYKIAWGPWHTVRDLYDEFSIRRSREELDGAFDRECLSFFSAPPQEQAGPPRWIILVALPRPAHSLTFRRDSKTARLLLPPTYVGYRATTRSVLEDLSRSVLGGKPVEPLAAPLKAIAARLGLVRYGRNNVTYAEEMGSYLQLVGGVTGEDLSGRAALPREPALLDACLNCTACVEACPTAAIPEDRFLLRAERCLVYFNERPEPFPPWVPEKAHRCAIGCMACQLVCPANRGLLRVERDAAVFSDEETRRILSPDATEDDPLVRSAREKLAALGLTEPGPLLWRNARAALARWPAG